MTHDEIQISMENDASDDSLNSIPEFENENMASHVTSNIIQTQKDLHASGSIPPSATLEPAIKSYQESEDEDGRGGFVLNLVKTENTPKNGRETTQETTMSSAF